MAGHEFLARNRGARPARGDQRRRPAEVLAPTYLVDAHDRQGLTTYQSAAETGFFVDTVTA
jgi:hypothetical protein